MMQLQRITLNLDAIDSNAIIISIVGYMIVFAALILLYAIFNMLPKLFSIKFKKREASPTPAQANCAERNKEMSGQVTAAISMALHLYNNQYHDIENTTMTIKKVSRMYSPWSSKIYQVRNQFNRS